MNTNILSSTTPPDADSTEPGGLWGALIALLLAAAAYLKRKFGGQPELITRAEFCKEMNDMNDRRHADHLALLEKLEANHRELLAVIGREAARVSGLEAGFARLDERTRKRP